jgi:1,4-dihydroxy-6-naphthoate synthase
VVSELEVGFSPCPNDTFMFHALVAGAVGAPWTVRPWLADIEALNERALSATPLAITKLSVHGLGHLTGRYAALQVGAALGRGCGPLVVAREARPLNDVRGRVAVPGRFTTAHLLLRIFGPPGLEVVHMRFEKILPAVAAGEVDAGVIIHEGRFVYGGFGLAMVADLGAVWEADTGLLLPLGVIAAARGLAQADVFEDRLRASIAAAWADPTAPAAFVRAHAQELDPEVCRRHIALYVNEYSSGLGDEGRAAVETLLRRGAEVGMLPRDARPWR